MKSTLLCLSFAFICLAAWCSLSLSLLAQEKTGASSVIVVRAQQKPDKEWKEYETRTLAQLQGFDREAVDQKLDEYGGRTDMKDKATGFFCVKKIGLRWWLVDPAGSLFYNKGVVSVTFGKSQVSEKEVESKFGGEAGWANSAVKMLRESGFNGTGAWSHESLIKKADPRLPYTLILNFMSGYGKRRGGTYQQPGHVGYPQDCIFALDSGFVKYCDESASQLDSLKNDPYLLGYFSDNELPFPSDALDKFLSLGGGDEGCRAATRWLNDRKGGSADIGQINDEDRAAFLELVAERYFSAVSQAIKKYDPNHLFLGSRFHGKTLNQKPVFTAAGRHADVISLNYYNVWTPSPEKMQNWVDWSGRPVLITEWYVKGADAGLSNTSGAGWIVPTQVDRGLFYQHFALSLAQFKGCVGWHWFKYIDNDPQAANVDPSNSDSNKGIVSIRFEPYTPLLDKMKELNSRVYRLIDYFDGQNRQ